MCFGSCGRSHYSVAPPAGLFSPHGPFLTVYLNFLGGGGLAAHMSLHVVTAPMATIYCREHAAAFAVMRNTFVDKATTEPSITASTLPISWMYKSMVAAAAVAVAAPLPPLHSPSPHINAPISFLTSLSLNRIKDFPDYYKREITSAASPRPPPPR